MNSELIKVFDALHPHVLQLRIRWAQYRFLFTTSDRRMAVLSHVAPGFFAIIMDVFRDDAFISLSRLTDKTITSGKNNLTLATLVEIAESSVDHELALSARLLFDQLCDQVSNIKTWRNKWLAHTDYDQAFLEKPLPDYHVQRGHVDRSISLVVDLMNLFAKHLEQPAMRMDLPIVFGDADVLARLLESLYDTPENN